MNTARTFPVLLAIAVALIAASSVSAQPITVNHDFRDTRFNPDLLRFDSGESEQFVVPEKEGLRIRYAPPMVPKNPVGVRWKTGVIGDFTATVHYEILKNEQPKQGYGVGLEFYLMLENPLRKSPDGLAFARNQLPTQGLVYYWGHRANNADEKRISLNIRPPIPTTPASDKGRLRFERTGGTLICSAAEGDGEEFKEQFRVEVGNTDLRAVRIAGITGGDPNATLDLRILDAQLKGILPGFDGVDVGKKVAANSPPIAKDGVQPAVAEQEPTHASRWFLIVVALLLLGVGGIFAAVLVFVMLRRTSAAKPTTENARKR